VALIYYVVNRTPEPPPELERVMEDVVLTLSDGTTLDATTLGGRPTVVVSWATWCPDCLGLLTTLGAIKERYGEKINAIAVNRKDDEQVVRDYRVAYTLPDTITYTRDSDDVYYKKSGGQAMPEVVVYDKDGNMSAHLLAIPTEEELNALLSSLLSN
jgi:thiol-disulfide isomerase/thioredoxin